MRRLLLVSCVALLATSAVGSATPGRVHLPRESFRVGEEIPVRAELPPGLHEMELLLVAGEFRLRLTKELDPEEPLILFRVPDFPVHGARLVMRASGVGLDEVDVAHSGRFDIVEGAPGWPEGPRLSTGPGGAGSEWWIGEDAPPEDHLAPLASVGAVPTVSGGRRRHPAIFERRSSRTTADPTLFGTLPVGVDDAPPRNGSANRHLARAAHAAAPVPLRI